MGDAGDACMDVDIRIAAHLNLPDMMVCVVFVGRWVTNRALHCCWLYASAAAVFVLFRKVCAM